MLHAVRYDMHKSGQSVKLATNSYVILVYGIQGARGE